MYTQSRKVPQKNSPENGFSEIAVTLFLFIILFAVTFSIAYFSGLNKNAVRVSNFPECINTKDSIVRESYPRVCQLPDGKTFTEILPETDKPGNSPTPLQDSINPEKTTCVISGCNGEICQNASAEPEASVCVYKEEFQCYKSAKCEVQANGECGWTPAEDFIRCLNKIESY